MPWLSLCSGRQRWLVARWLVRTWLTVAVVAAGMGIGTAELVERSTAERQRFLDYHASHAGLHHADVLLDGLRKMRDRSPVLFWRVHVVRQAHVGLQVWCMSQVLPLWRHHNPMPMVHDRIFASGMSEADIAALQVAN